MRECRAERLELVRFGAFGLVRFTSQEGSVRSCPLFVAHSLGLISSKLLLALLFRTATKLNSLGLLNALFLTNMGFGLCRAFVERVCWVYASWPSTRCWLVVPPPNPASCNKLGPLAGLFAHEALGIEIMCTCFVSCRARRKPHKNTKNAGRPTEEDRTRECKRCG